MADVDREGGREDDRAPMMPLAEAAAKTGKHPEALRSLARRGRIRATKNNAGQWLVAVDDRELAEALAGSDRDGDRDHDRQMADLVTTLREEIAELREQAAELRADLKAERAIRDAAAVLHQQLTDQLTAMLAEARKPWWRRWIGS